MHSFYLDMRFDSKQRVPRAGVPGAVAHRWLGTGRSVVRPGGVIVRTHASREITFLEKSCFWRNHVSREIMLLQERVVLENASHFLEKAKMTTVSRMAHCQCAPANCRSKTYVSREITFLEKSCFLRNHGSSWCRCTSAAFVCIFNVQLISA